MSNKENITKALTDMKCFQLRIRKHIEDNYVDFMPNSTSSDFYLDDGEILVREADNLIQTLCSDAKNALNEANDDLTDIKEKLCEASLGLNLSHRILKVDDLFQCVEEANATKEYFLALDYLGKLKKLILADNCDDVDNLFQKCECYPTIKVKYVVQSHLLEQNLLQRFEQLVQFTEKPFKNSTCVTLTVSKDVNQLQDTVMAMFQTNYNPTKFCEFLLEKCFEPLILKPVSIEHSEDNPDYVQLILSYSLKDLGDSLRPSYNQVFENIKLVLHCLRDVNVSISSEKHVFSIIGEHVKERLLTHLVDGCLMHSIPETADEYRESNLKEDVILFEQYLADNFLINIDTDRTLHDFVDSYETYFRNQYFTKLVDGAKDIMRKDLQDMTMIAEKNTTEDVSNNPFLFPRCMVSKSTLELIKLMERILRQISEMDNTNNDNYLKVIELILNCYVSVLPQIHEKLLENIPQQSALFYNNCMFLAHWVAKNTEKSPQTFPTLVKTLQSTGKKYLNVQIDYQQKIIMDILTEFDLSDVHTIGVVPIKLIRQCLRQLDLLKNVWQNVLPNQLYNSTFCHLLNDFCNDIIKRVLTLEDISETVANELGELIEMILDKAPNLFHEKHEVVHIKSWLKLKQLKDVMTASLQEITEQWCEGVGILSVSYKAEEVRHLIRALFQNTDRRAKALEKIV